MSNNLVKNNFNNRFLLKALYRKTCKKLDDKKLKKTYDELTICVKSKGKCYLNKKDLPLWALEICLNVTTKLCKERNLI